MKHTPAEASQDQGNRNATSWLRSLLGFPGIHYVATRFGGSRLRAASFDQKYASGDWNFETDNSSELASVVEKYAAKGKILMLGCGTGSIATKLAPESFESFQGIDLSHEAISRAKLRETERIRFEVCDIVSYRCSAKYNVILFSEALYYINPLYRESLLKRCSQDLTRDGWIIVTIAQPLRYAGILRMIRRSFDVVEDRCFHRSSRRLLVFR